MPSGNRRIVDRGAGFNLRRASARLRGSRKLRMKRSRPFQRHIARKRRWRHGRKCAMSSRFAALPRPRFRRRSKSPTPPVRREGRQALRRLSLERQYRALIPGGSRANLPRPGRRHGSHGIERSSCRYPRPNIRSWRINRGVARSDAPHRTQRLSALREILPAAVLRTVVAKVDGLSLLRITFFDWWSTTSVLEPGQSISQGDPAPD